MTETHAHVIIANTQFKGIVDHLQEALPGAQVEMIESGELVEHIERAHVLIPTMARIGEPVFAAGARLRLVQQWGVGLEGVDIASATAHGVAVANVPSDESRNADSVAEWSVMAAVGLSRGFPGIMLQVQAGGPWGSPSGRGLLGKTAGLVGFGGIGKALAVRLAAFGMRIVAVKRQADPALAAQYNLAWLRDMAALPDLLRESDYVFLGVPLKEETRGLIGAAELGMMRPGSCVINAARGGIVDEPALAAALQQGAIGGAALDVFTKEPPDAHDPLLQCPNLIVTPHIAGITDVSFSGIAAVVARNIERVMAGAPPLHCANCDKG